MSTTTHTLKTRSEAPFVIVYVGRQHTPPTIEGYAYTQVRANQRAQRKGRGYVVAPVVDGTITVEVPEHKDEATLIAEHNDRQADPVELMAREVVRLRFEHRVDSTIREVTDVDREEARRILRTVLLTSTTGRKYTGWKLVHGTQLQGTRHGEIMIQADQVWQP